MTGAGYARRFARERCLSLWIALSMACAVCVSFASARVRAESGFAGEYAASPAHIEANVTAWGGDCGVRPQTYTASEQPKVEVRDQGSHLVLIYPDRTLRTNTCWSPNPTVKLTSTSASDNRWRTECRTAQTEVRKEAGRYTVTAKGNNALDLLEESDYDWRLNESHCVAQVRITQHLERVRGAGKIQRTIEPACVPGAPTRIRLRPQEARLEPGGRVCFAPRGFDAQGCGDDLDPNTLHWELKKTNGTRATLTANCFKAADAAADGEGTFQVVATLDAMHTEAVVTVSAPDLSDITARRSAASATPHAPDAVPAPAGELAGTGVKAVGVDARVHWGELALIAACVLAALGVLGFVMVRMRRRTARVSSAGAPAPASSWATPVPATREPTREPTPMAARPAPNPPAAAAPAQVTQVQPPQPAQPAPAPANSSETLICPTCRRGFTPGTERCSSDGTPLMPYSEFARRAKQGEIARKTCLACGTALSPDAVFCGVCGKRVGA